MFDLGGLSDNALCSGGDPLAERPRNQPMGTIATWLERLLGGRAEISPPKVSTP